MTAFPVTKSLDDIVPDARPHFEELLLVAEQLGLQPRIRSAGRTCADQNGLKALGPGVTGAGMCRSLHVVGRAIDVDLSPSTCANYTKLGEVWEQMGGFWGGRWSQFGGCGDAGHFHWMPKPGGGNHQAVPVDICPATVSLAECEALRDRYLAEQFAMAASPLMASAGKVALVLAVAVTAFSVATYITDRIER